MKTLVRFVIFLLLLLAGIAGIAFYWTFYKPLPDYEATLTLDGIQNEVTIMWDAHGVPHIFAENQHDLYYALGYVHAQDRLWQMTLSQIAGEGRLAEFIDTELVPYDKYQRTIGFWRTAQMMERNLADSTRTLLEHYSDGVNAFTERSMNKLPIEFSLLEIDPIPWTPTHSLSLSRMMAWELNVSWWTEAMFGYLNEELSEEQFQQLTAAYEDYPISTLSEEETQGLGATLIKSIDRELDFRELLNRSGSSVGSNAWVVDGEHSRSGYPLLAGDPHLALDMPGKWYEVHLHLNGRNVSGATLAGAPAIIVGQNDHMAWSFTSMMPDDSDFFVERVNPDDRGQYQVDSTAEGNQYRNFEIDRQIIKTKGGGEELLEVRHTKHGPVISDIFPGGPVTEGKVMSIQWAGYEMSYELDALMRINWAQSFEAFKQAVPLFQTPGMNFMYGDRIGNIAMYSAARIPLRDFNPILPRKGWDPAYDWKGFVPFDELPRVINPEKGWIANANNKLTGDDYPHYLATFWEPTSRIRRINERLRAQQKFSVSDFKTLQTDYTSLSAKDLTGHILPILEKADSITHFPTVISYLENWNYKYEKSATAASIDDVFMNHFVRQTLEDEIGPEVMEQFLRIQTVPVRAIEHLIADSSVLYDDIRTDSIRETRTQIIINSMKATIAELEEKLGEEPYQWRWEQLHTVTLKPPLFGQAASDPEAPEALRLIVNNVLSVGPYPVGGNSLTINNMQYKWEDPYEVTLGPSIRRIVDLKEPGSSLTVLPTGQSGNPISDYFGDQTQMWLKGEYRRMVQDTTRFSIPSARTMRLVPADN